MPTEITKSNEELNKKTDALIEARECLNEVRSILHGTSYQYIRQKVSNVLELIREALK